MSQTSAFGAPASDQPLASLAIERRDPGPRDVSIDILYCGVCHSDLHFVRGEWGQQSWPIVPGHEIVGRVTAVGDEVEGFAVGDIAGVGCMVDSCRTCSACAEDLEQFCENGNTLTYGSEEKQTGRVTQGGYSNAIVVDQDFCLHVAAVLLYLLVKHDDLIAPMFSGRRRDGGSRPVSFASSRLALVLFVACAVAVAALVWWAG